MIVIDVLIFGFCVLLAYFAFTKREMWWFVLLVALAMNLIINARARAHQAPSGWEYPKECCDGMDCAPVPFRVQPTFRDGGVEFRLKPGDHPMITTQEHVIFWKTEALLRSPDDEWHICLRENDDHVEVYCVYQPRNFGA